MTAPTADSLRGLHAEAREVAGVIRLPFRQRSWRGPQGALLGSGTGNSMDFQDHRPYQAGDDPRYINWQAYARSGHYTMKVYRQESSPSVDLLIDLSASMFVDEEKARRAAELAYWVAEAALQAGAAVRCHVARASGIRELPLPEFFAHEWVRPEQAEQPPDLSSLPWRQGSLRVLLSDLLWPGDHAALLHPLAEGNGLPILLVPFSRGESDPDWEGNLEILDCETGRSQPCRVERDLAARYRAAYRRHFQYWEDAALRHRAAFARIDATLPLAASLQEHVGETGAAEWA